MDSDGEDFELFSPAESNSPPVVGRRFKRLKKAGNDFDARSPADPPHDAGRVDFGGSGGGDSDDDVEDSGLREESVGVEEGGLGFGGGEEGSDVSGIGVKRALVFDKSDEGESEGGGDCEGGEEGNEGEVGGDGDKVKEKRKKETKRIRVERSVEFGVRSDDGDSAEEDSHPITKRVSEKARRNQLTLLRADSQRLLRESRNTGFKPMPLVHKPISSVLEKIRQRKLELAKKSVPFKKDSFSFPFPDLLRDGVELIVDNKESGKKEESSTAAKVVNGNSVASPIDAEIDENNLHEDGSNDAPSKRNHVDIPPQDGIKQLYRSPVDDTQDLFSYSESDSQKDDLAEIPRMLNAEVFAPSVLAMNLQLDSAPQDDSSDEGDNDKENIDPLLHQSDDFSLDSLGDPVKNFIDAEAEEEDDSDNDMNRFQENEEEDSEDAEELNDMIAPDYKEGDADKERRNELHQKWLEQQDAAGTENLLKRLGCGPKKTTAGLVGMVDDGEDEVREKDDIEELSEDDDDLAQGNVARINFRKVQQMIPQMFTDTEDAYLSSEDEEFEKRLAKQNLLLKTELRGSLVSPAEDENSREVFRLIKKLNIMPHNKKRAKSLVLDDNTLLKGRPNDLLKPSFLGKGSTSLSSSKNQKTNTFKGFIFGRDDSSCKSTTSACEDSDMIEQEVKPVRTSSSTKPKSSQSSRHSSQATTDAATTLSASSTSSLYDILRRSSVKNDQWARSTSLDQSKSMFSAFRVGSKSKEGRART